MRPKTYANAQRILPSELLKEVQKHHTGFLWVPVSEHSPQTRRELVLSFKEQGLNTKEIALFVGITTRRVNQILAQEHTI